MRAHRPKRSLLAAAILVVLATSCGGGGGGNGGGGVIPGARVAGFAADDPTPPGDSVSLQLGPRANDVVTVLVSVAGVTDFFGAAFHVTYDPALVTFQGFDSTGSFLRDGAFPTSALQFSVGSTAAGNLAVAATRLQNGNGTAAGVNVGGTPRTLIALSFKANADTAGTRVNLAQPREARDSQDFVIPLTWLGGAITAN